MRGFRGVSLASVAAVGAIAVLLLSTTTVFAFSAFSNPSSGPVGSQALVSGAAWPAGYNLRVTWDDGTTLGDTVVDANGAFALQVTIPANASTGEHSLRLSAWVGQFIPVCIAVTGNVPFTVTIDGEPTPTAGVVEPTATASAPATVTDPSCATATVTSTATSTSSVTVTSTSLSGSTATRTPTKTGLPRTGSAGLLGTDDSDGGPGAAAFVALALLGGGLALTGTYILRQRRAA